MKNDLCRLLAESGLTGEEIDTCQYELRTSGSPYTEVEAGSIRPGQTVFVNPYHHYYRAAEPLLEADEFRGTAEGKLLFHQLIRQMYEIDRYQGLDRNTVKRELLRKRLLEGCYGEHIRRFLEALTASQQNATCDTLLMMYRSKEEVYGFVCEIQLLFPKSIIFREYCCKDRLYVCLGTEKQEYALWQYQAVEKLFLPMDITVCLTWNQPFALTDLNGLKPPGSRLV